MDAPTSPSLTWSQFLAYAIIAIISASGTYLTTLLNKRKIPSEIHKTDAETDLAHAQADDLRLRSNLSAGQMVSEMVVHLGLAQVLIGELRDKIAQRDATISLLEAQVEEARARGDLKRLTGD